MPVTDTLPPHERVFTDEYWTQIPGATNESFTRIPYNQHTSRNGAKSLRQTLKKIRDGEQPHRVFREGEPFRPRDLLAGVAVNFVDEELAHLTPELHERIQAGENTIFSTEFIRPNDVFDDEYTLLVGIGPRAPRQFTTEVLGETDDGPAVYTRRVGWGIVMPKPHFIKKDNKPEDSRLLTLPASFVDGHEDGEIASFFLGPTTSYPYYEWENGRVYDARAGDDWSVPTQRRISQTTINYPAHAPSSRASLRDVVASFMRPASTNPG